MVNEANTDNIIDSSKTYIKDRRDFLNQQEKELKDTLELGKKKEEEIRKRLLALQQKLGITVEEEEIIQEKFGNKSGQEIQTIINQEKHNPKANRLAKKLIMLGMAGILLIAGGQKLLQVKMENNIKEEAKKDLPGGMKGIMISEAGKHLSTDKKNTAKTADRNIKKTNKKTAPQIIKKNITKGNPVFSGTEKLAPEMGTIIKEAAKTIETKEFDKRLMNPYIVGALYYSDNFYKKTVNVGDETSKIVHIIKNKIDNQEKNEFFDYLVKKNISSGSEIKEIPLDGDFNYGNIGKNHKDALDLFQKEGSNVKSICSGIVILAENTRKADNKISTSSYKGGNTVIIFDPLAKECYRYAHLSESKVKTGDIVQAGAEIGKMGHTGKNAMKPGHGNHLHVEINKIAENITVAKTNYEIKKVIDNLKKTKKDIAGLQTIPQMIADKKNSIIIQNPITSGNIALEVKRVQGEIARYRIQPNIYTMKRKDENYDENKPGYDKIQTINFTVRNRGSEIGIIKFDRKGNLMSREMEKQGKTYYISQDGANIQITEGLITSN